MKRVVIVSAARTPIGNFQKSLKDIPATRLGAVVVSEVIKRAGLSGKEIDEVIMGNVLPVGLGQNPARQAMLKAGLPLETSAFTINKVCGSGLMAVMLGVRSIISGEAEVVIAGGMENMSLAPHEHMIRDGLWDVVNDFHMGYSAELVARRFRISRSEAD